MIDLNAEELKPVSIFNDGKAGLVKDVTLEVTKKQPSDPDNRPDFNLVITDSSGATLREGFYHFTPNSMKDDAANQATLDRTIRRFGTIARAAMGADFIFPELKTPKQAYEVLFDIIGQGVQGKKFNVFVTYGTTNYVNKNGYLKLRYFDFIEPAGETTRLKVKNSDLMERVTPDSDNMPSTPSLGGSISGTTVTSDSNSMSVQSWTS